MERRRGRTLDELLERVGPLPPLKVERVLREIGEALRELHRRGVVHRGVRPESIFLDRDSGHARLAPFAVDRHDEADPFAALRMATLRTFAYLAPEQIAGEAQVDGRSLSPRSDLFSLGLVGYTMLTGRQPWTDQTLKGLLEQRRREPLPALAGVRDGIPDYLVSAIEGCLDRNPSRRWKNAEEFLEYLEAAAGKEAVALGDSRSWLRGRTEPPAPRPVAPPVEPGRQARWKRFPMRALGRHGGSKLAVTAAALVIGLLAMGVLWGSDGVGYPGPSQTTVTMPGGDPIPGVQPADADVVEPFADSPVNQAAAVVIVPAEEPARSQAAVTVVPSPQFVPPAPATPARPARRTAPDQRGRQPRPVEPPATPSIPRQQFAGTIGLILLGDPLPTVRQSPTILGEAIEGRQAP
jgi:hypothetical protein